MSDPNGGTATTDGHGGRTDEGVGTDSARSTTNDIVASPKKDAKQGDAASSETGQ